METVPYLDLRAEYRPLRSEVLSAFEEICESTSFAQGSATSKFEAKFAAYCGVHHCVSLNSGTSALHLALRCLDVGPGDEVVTVSMTFIATAWAISYVGALITDDASIARRARSLRDHAQSQKYLHDEIGYNYRMDSFQGAVLAIKLKHLDEWNKARVDCARQYTELLKASSYTLPALMSDSECVWHCYVIETPERERVRSALQDAGIETAVHYPVPVHLQKAYAHLGYRTPDLPVTEILCQQCLSLPIYPELSKEKIFTVASVLLDLERHK